MYDFSGPRSKEAIEMFVKTGFMNQEGKTAPRMMMEEESDMMENDMMEPMMDMGAAASGMETEL